MMIENYSCQSIPCEFYEGAGETAKTAKTAKTA